MTHWPMPWYVSAEIAELRRRLGNAAQQRVVQDYSIENLVDKTDNHYRQMLQTAL